MNIRIASMADVEGIAHVHLESWRTTYQGIISESYLSNLTLQSRINNWSWTFHHLNQDEVIFVAEDKPGNMIGFINGGKNIETNFDYDAQIYALYLLKAYQGQGTGRILVQNLIGYLQSKRYKSLLVAVLEKNPAVQFYKRLGGTLVSKKEIKIGEEQLMEDIYGWKEMSKGI